MKQPSVSTDCHLLPEMVDDAMGQLASQEGDVRAAVAEARRVADAVARPGFEPGTSATPQEPAWPVEPGSLSEAVYWYRQTAGLGDAPGPAEVAASLSNLGYAWREQQRWAEAETAFRECLQLRQQHGDRAGVGQTFFDLGSLYQAQERWTDAEPALVQGSGDCPRGRRPPGRGQRPGQLGCRLRHPGPGRERNPPPPGGRGSRQRNCRRGLGEANAGVHHPHSPSPAPRRSTRWQGHVIANKTGDGTKDWVAGSSAWSTMLAPEPAGSTFHPSTAVT